MNKKQSNDFIKSPKISKKIFKRLEKFDLNREKLPKNIKTELGDISFIYNEAEPQQITIKFQKFSYIYPLSIYVN